MGLLLDLMMKHAPPRWRRRWPFGRCVECRRLFWRGVWKWNWAQEHCSRECCDADMARVDADYQIRVAMKEET